MSLKKVKKAIISVSDKSNLKIILPILKKFKVEIISSGGTFKKIKSLGYKCLEVSSYTGFKEMLNGRVKTLHTRIHAEILHDRSNKKHKIEMRKRKFSSIDLVVVNFYPFKNTVQKTNKMKQIIENIDIGGPTLVRAAAKNYKDVTVITDKSNNFHNSHPLITTNTEDFQNLAIDIASNKNKLKKIKDDLNNSLSNSSLFDSVKFTKDLETLYQKISDEKN